MFLKTMVIALSLFVAGSVQALNHGFEFHRQSLLRKYNPLLTKIKASQASKVHFFEQKLDHKSKSSKITFKQRYFIDSQYATAAQSPVFYIICGEWNCAGTESYSFVSHLAKKMKAHLVALEHRYYGESLPTNKLTPAALKYLDLTSAVADLATVQKFLMDSRNMKGPWVAFGGSYAGTLAAFYREKHPELIAGALASSAPVFMKNEFSEYDAHVAKVVNKTSCGDQVRAAVKKIEVKMTSKEGALEVKKLFKAEEVKDDRDFLYVVADMLSAAVQYGRDKMFCDVLASNPDLISGYAKAGLQVLGAMGSTPFEISLAVAERTTVTPDDNLRQWMWQSCREFGWFQVANGTGKDTSRSSRIDLGYHEDICQRLYGVSMGLDGALNDNWYHPLFDPATSKIIFSNGSNDPWLTLSVTSHTSESNPEFGILMMDGAAHCDDLTLMTKYPSVKMAHTSIEKIIEGWLN